MSDCLSAILTSSPRPVPTEHAEQIHAINHDLKAAMRNYRVHIVGGTAEGTVHTSEALRRMDTTRWLRRLGYHVWRISYHLTNPQAQTQALSPRAAAVEQPDGLG